MLTAKELMNRDVVSVEPDDSVTKSVALLIKQAVSSLPVVDASGHLLGVVSEFDLLELVVDASSGKSPVYRYMTRQVHSVEEDATLMEVAELFRRLGVSRLPVVREDRLVGIITRRDLLGHYCTIRGYLPSIAAS